MFQVLESLGIDCTYQTLSMIQEHRLNVADLYDYALPPNLDPQQGVILSGKAPVWLYNYWVDSLHDFPWVACFDPKFSGAVVVSSRVAAWRVGDLIPMRSQADPCGAIIIGGPPNSGKSTLAHSLRERLTALRPELRLSLQWASWDGEGSHTYENPDPVLAKQLADASKYKIHLDRECDRLVPEYFDYQGKAIANLRCWRDLVLVDVGGLPQAEKGPVVAQCTHWIIISNNPEAVAAWQGLFQGLQPLAVIHSVREERLEIIREHPYLELIAGPWVRGCSIPDELCDRVLSILP